MEQQFWRDLWTKGEAAWRQPEANRFLKRYWQVLNLPAGATVLVPLCGDSIDMVWLMQAGFHVVGVELHRSAVEAFFKQLAIEPQISVENDFTVFRAENITIYCGDIFKVTSDMMVDVAAVYDRGATVALPPEMRTKYARLLGEVLQPEVTVLLIGNVYDETAMDGPPFSVPDEEIDRLYQAAFHIELLESERPETVPEPLAEHGLTWTENVIYKLARH